MTTNSTISVIITTYNWPSALKLVLLALDKQTVDDFEVIIADDGSTEETSQLITDFSNKSRYPLQHIWHEDNGFRAAMIRNKAVAKASGDYIIFIDGDCIPQTTFISRHKSLAETGRFVAGNRILLSRQFTTETLTKSTNLSGENLIYWSIRRLKGDCNRLLPLIHLPLKQLRNPNKRRWHGVKTCNLAVWRKDFLLINGFDESYKGWGYEDSDLVIRLIRAGIYHKSGRFAIPVFHLDHETNDRSNTKNNRKRLNEVLEGKKFYADEGVDKYFRTRSVF